MCRRSTVASSEPSWPEESSRPHAPHDPGWYTSGGDGWSTSGDHGWYTSGDHARYTSGDCAWSSLGRSMTALAANICVHALAATLCVRREEPKLRARGVDPGRRSASGRGARTMWSGQSMICRESGRFDCRTIGHLRSGGSGPGQCLGAGASIWRARGARTLDLTDVN